MDDWKIIDDFVGIEALIKLRYAFGLVLKQTAVKHDSQVDLANASDLHGAVLATVQHDKRVLTDAINVFMHSAAFGSFFDAERVDRIIEDLYPGADPSDLIITERNFRVDLPQEFSVEAERFSLGWHQESGYFQDFVSHQNGWVIWMPLFSCSRNQGAVKVVANSAIHGPVEHETVVLDRENNRNIRKLVPDSFMTSVEDKCSVIEVTEGDAAAFHFNTLHATGINEDPDYVRFTIQARVSLHSDASFRTGYP